MAFLSNLPIWFMHSLTYLRCVLALQLMTVGVNHEPGASKARRAGYLITPKGQEVDYLPYPSPS